jgi:hypothetical protein
MQRMAGNKSTWLWVMGLVVQLLGEVRLHERFGLLLGCAADANC